MRFSIAATILACQALPTASLLDERKESIAAIGSAWAERGAKIAQQVAPKVVQHQQRKAKALERRLGKARQRPLANKRRKAKKEQVECDPNAPDQGILACGDNRYCAESRTSSAGGVCASSSRRLQSCSADTPCPETLFCNYDFGDSGYCESCPCGDPASTCTYLGVYSDAGTASCEAVCEPIPEGEYCQPYPICDYSDFNQTSGVGTYSCTGYSCVGYCCYTYVESGVGYADGSYTVSYSYYFNQPYSQNFTVTTGSAGTCEVELDGTVCASCEVQQVPYGGFETCYQHDCSNANPYSVPGNTCDGVVPFPIYSQCYSYNVTNTTFCDICPSSYLAYPNATVQFPGTPYALECSYIYLAGVFGAFTPYECAGVEFIAGSTCCAGNYSVAPGCSICGNNTLQHPNSTITIPGTGTYSCYDLYYAGLYGYFGSDGCTYLEYVVGPTCCNPDGPPSCSVCPGDAPVSNPDRNLTLGDLTATCAEVQQFGILGLIPPALCGAAQLAVPGLCGCDSLPTMPPVAMPTEPPVSMPTEPPVEESMVPAPVDTMPPVEAPPPDTIAPAVAETNAPSEAATEEPASAASYFKGMVSLVGLSLAVAAFNLAA